MKAVQCVEWGMPDRLVVSDLELPEPKAGEVRVRVEAAGVNFPDALIVQKKYQVQPPLPFTPGTEVAGTVDALGEGVSHLKPGDRVAAFVGLGGFASSSARRQRRLRRCRRESGPTWPRRSRSPMRPRITRCSIAAR